ncbi:MAG: exodeoxyribonuclease VII large subunit [candidate division Zixibacteria bacterium]|nr:exodeoxyribonuclease VII large subunit [candidate division Zixibacteria bacterium]
MASDPEMLTVTDLNYRVKTLLERHFEGVCVTGEVSNFKAYQSGHWYFSLKDDRSQLRAVMFRHLNQSVTFLPHDGMKVVAFGTPSLYEARGEYQLMTVRLLPAGIGEWAAAFERLKAKLEAEGLFDPARKRPLSRYPECVGVITSGSGAAIRDIIRVLRRRAPHVRIVVRPTPVQGEGAAGEIVRAIAEMNEYGSMDTLIVGRGGGSIEDLWVFNEESVVRAIAGSQIPTISAVGHETDYTLADFAADVRASTPSVAAETAAPERGKLLERVSGALGWIHKSLTGRIARHRQRLEELHRVFRLRSPLDLIHRRAQETDDLAKRVSDRWRAQMEQRRQHLAGLAGRLQALSPLAVLERGYALCRTPAGVVIRDASLLEIGSRVDVKFYKGNAVCRVEDLNRPPGPLASPPPRRTVRTDQGSLFDDP